MKAPDYKREEIEWTEATVKDLGETWREVVSKQRPAWVSGLIPPRVHPKADDHVVWFMTTDEATFLLQIIRKGSTE